VIAIILFIISVVKKLKKYIIISFFLIYLGFITQTGIGEFSILKGRSGWYLMYCTAVLIAMGADDLFKVWAKRDKTKFFYSILSAIVTINVALALITPPSAYRLEKEESLKDFKSFLVQETNSIKNNEKILVYTDFASVNLISNKLETYEDLNTNLRVFNLIFLNLDTGLPDLVQANARNYEDRDFDKFFSRVQDQRDDRLRKNYKLINLAKSENFRVVKLSELYIIMERI
jgi:hypothetical protein